jgi:hypothetical protein
MPPKKKIKTISAEELLELVKSTNFSTVEEYQNLVDVCEEKIKELQSGGDEEALQSVAETYLKTYIKKKEELEEEGYEEDNEEAKADFEDILTLYNDTIDLLTHGTFSDVISEKEVLEYDRHEGEMLTKYTHSFTWTYNDVPLTFSYVEEVSGYGRGNGTEASITNDLTGYSLSLSDCPTEWKFNYVDNEEVNEMINGFFEAIYCGCKRVEFSNYLR